MVLRWRRGLMSVQGRAELNSTASCRLDRNLHQVLGTSNVQVGLKTTRTKLLVKQSIKFLPQRSGHQLL